jgi:hypothetical protein
MLVFAPGSDKREDGHYRFSEKLIGKISEKKPFTVIRIKDTVYQGTIDPLPAASFLVVMKNSKKR